MAQFIVRNLEDDVRDKLRELAQSHGQSMEETVRDILRCAVAKARGAKSCARFTLNSAFCFSWFGQRNSRTTWSVGRASEL